MNESSILVEDLGDNLPAGPFDLAFFGCGYEGRCTYIPTQIRRLDLIIPAHVLGFSELSNTNERRSNDKYFWDNWGLKPLLLPADDEGLVYDLLDALSPGTSPVRLLVDYSSMSRLWYAGILNWARFRPPGSETEIVFAYALGQYEADAGTPKQQPMVIATILAVPGFEGHGLRLGGSVVAIGLGFEGSAALCVIDQLEPDTTLAFTSGSRLASMTGTSYDDLVLDQNRELLKEADYSVTLPLESVSTTYGHLAELLAPYRIQGDSVIIPMGPKPQVLASLLLGMRFPEIGCLRVSKRRTRPEAVSATGSMVVTSVQIRK